MDQAKMLAWYGSLHPLTVDVVGDFAGKELFAIHGDSMLLHCITKVKVDYDHGFQLLHAIHAVETFLDNLKRRGCKFHILWFDDQENLCVPVSTKQPELFLLTRAILIKHLARYEVSGGGKLSFQFPGMESAGYNQYLKESSVHFFLCLNGRATFGALNEGKYDTDGVPWNAYIYDFFKPGNMQALVADNGIKSGDVWFQLKDFSLILATITTRIANYFSLEPTDDAMVDVQDVGDVMSDGLDEADREEPGPAKVTRDVKTRVVPVRKKLRKVAVADSWEDEMDGGSEDEVPASSEPAGEESSGGEPRRQIEDNDLMLVLTAFKKLQEGFDEKFKKVWT